MVEAGILDDAERVELLDGVLVEMSPQGPLHAAVATALARLLDAAYSEHAHTRDAKPLLASDYSLPEPDLAVVHGRPEDYLARHPTGRDALLVIELAWSSAARDEAKAPIYAAAGVPEYWLVELAEGIITRHVESDGRDYQTLTFHDATERLALPGVEEAIVFAELLRRG